MESKILINKGDRGLANQRKYIIDAKWWRKWCDYTGFNQIDHILIDTINVRHEALLQLGRFDSDSEREDTPPFEIRHKLTSDDDDL